MRFAFVRRGLPTALVLAALAACNDGAPAQPPLPEAGLRGQLVAFEVSGVLTAKPGESVRIGLLAAPEVRSIAVSLQGEYDDASLDAERLVPKDGRASFLLHAPSQPSTFSVLAKTDSGSTARLDVAVSRAGFAKVRVLPSYKGTRALDTLVASAFLKATCKDLAAMKPVPDGAPLVTGPLGQPLDLDNVPAGGRVAVAVRAGQYAFGCDDVLELPTGGSRDVPVELFDRPVDLAKTDLEARFTFEPQPSELTAWNDLLTSASNLALAAFSPVGTTQDEAARLLDAMSDASGQTAAFGFARTQGAWDGKVKTHLAQRPPSLRVRAEAWLSAGLPSTLGDLVVHLASGPGPQQATLALVTLGAADAKTAGYAAPLPFLWAADGAEDAVRLEGSLQIAPSALACATADVDAAAKVPGAKDVPTALSLAVDCPALATTLGGFGACTGSCMEQLCGKALGSLWAKGRDASSAAQQMAALRVNLGTKVTVGESAEPTAFSGAWVGDVKPGSGPSFGMRGSAKGATGMVPK
jgi:hypothetical protein